MVLASERPVIQTALNVSAGSINELQPGQAILISKTGKMRLAQTVSYTHLIRTTRLY